MANASNYLENAICNVLRGTTLAGITPFVALFDGNPGEAGTGATEVTTTIRTAGRVAVIFGAPTDGVITNDGIIDFGTSVGAATVAGFGVYDAASAGNLLAYGTLASQSVIAGNDVSFPVGSLTVTVA